VETVVASGGNHTDRQSETTRFETVMIKPPSRWRSGARFGHPIVLNRGRLQLEVRLPVGSSEGKYRLRVSDKFGKVRKTVASTACTEDGITRLKVVLDNPTYPG